MSMAPSCNATPSAINPNRTRTSVQGEKTLKRKARLQKDKSIIYLANARDCGGCSLKQRCTTSTARRVSRHMFEESLTRMNERATAAVMRLRRSIVEHPFATIKYRILGHP